MRTAAISALLALELGRRERVRARRVAGPAVGAVPCFALDAGHDLGAFLETVHDLHELAVGDAGPDPDRLGLALLVQDEHQVRSDLGGRRVRGRGSGRRMLAAAAVAAGAGRSHGRRLAVRSATGSVTRTVAVRPTPLAPPPA